MSVTMQAYRGYVFNMGVFVQGQSLSLPDGVQRTAELDAKAAALVSAYVDLLTALYGGIGDGGSVSFNDFSSTSTIEVVAEQVPEQPS